MATRLILQADALTCLFLLPNGALIGFVVAEQHLARSLVLSRL